MKKINNVPPRLPRWLLAQGLPPALCLLSLARPVSVLAACDNNVPASGTTVSCSGAIAARVSAVPGSTSVTVNVAAGSTMTLTRIPGVPDAALSVDTASQITSNGAISLSGIGGTGTNRAAGLLGTGNGNTLTNGSQGSIATAGAFNDGMAANGSGNTLVNNGTISTAGSNAYGMSAAWGQTNQGQSGNNLVNTGSITTTGSNARGMSILGGNGSITNRGSVLVTGQDSPGAYMQGNGNRLVNSGIIEARGGNSVPPLSPNGVFSNTASSGFTASIENQAGGQIISRQGFAVRTLNGASTLINAGLLQSDVGAAVDMGTGANTMILQTGSVIRGSASGGGNPATRLILQGTGTADNAFLNFPTLQMQGSDWSWSGSGNFSTVSIQSGRFNLTGTLGGATTVQPGATLAGTGVLTGSLLNQGIVHPGTGSASGQLTVNGSYTGSNGVLQTESVLGADGSPAGRLVVSGGAIGGTTTIQLTNLAGAGGFTAVDGIALVQAANGATSSAGAFMLAGGSVSAGAYTYYLFKGGTTAGTANTWYLRSTLPPVPAPTPAPAPGPVPAPVPEASVVPQAAPGTPDLPPPPPPGSAPTPLYRPEVPVYAEVPAMARQLGIEQIGTFHDRQGQQSLADENGRLPASWARVWGGHSQQGQQGAAAPAFNGSLVGLQLGQDLYADTRDSGHRNHYGVMLGFARASGDVSGFAQGFPELTVGSLAINAYSLGAYWTHIGPTGWYTDAVVQGSSLTVDPRSDRGVGSTTHGHAISTSLEAGLPIALGGGFTLEPQAQLIWQHVSINDLQDGISNVSFQNANGWLGRLGARMETRLQRHGVTWMPYLRANLLKTFGGTDQTIYAGTDAIGSSLSTTAAQFGIGVAARMNRSCSLYASAGYTTNLDSTRRNSIYGNLGVRWSW